MSPRWLFLSCASALAFSPNLHADAPQIQGIAPLGIVRGAPAEVAITGANLDGNPQLITSIPFTIDPAASKAEAGKWTIKLTIPKEIPLGVYPFRVQTDDGLSNPFLLALGQFPPVPEAEDNSTFEQAQMINLPAWVEGQVAGSDVDFFKFTAKKGQRIVIDAHCARVGSGVDPQIRLSTATRKFVASADDAPGLLTEAMLIATLPEDGEYVVEISDSKYQGSGRPVYRLLIGAVPYATDVFPLGGRRGETVGFELRGGTIDGSRIGAMTLLGQGEDISLKINSQQLGLTSPGEPPLDIETPTPIRLSDLPEIRESIDPASPAPRAAPPVVVNGRIDPPSDEDRFKLVVNPGQTYRIKTEASLVGSALDGTLQILAPDGKQLAAAEDTTVPPIAQRRQRNAPGVVLPDPSIDFKVPDGITEITLAMKDLLGRGGPGYGYRIEIEPVTPTFDVIPTDAQISIPKGGTVAIPVTIARLGFNGPVTLGLADPPPGLTARPGTVPTGQAAGVLSVSATPDAALGAITLNIIGTAQGPGGPITVSAHKPVVLSQIANLPVSVVDQSGMPAALQQPRPVRLETPESVDAVHGLATSITIKALRNPGADAALAVTPLPLPAGLQLPNANIAEKAAEGTVSVTIPVEAPFEPITIALAAKGKLDGKDQTLFTPAITLKPVRPVALEPAARQFEMKPGETYELKGKISRKEGMKEPVTLKLDGLPGGLSAEPVTLAPDAAEFTLKVVAAPDAAAAEAKPKLALAFKIGGKDYPFPAEDIALKVVK